MSNFIVRQEGNSSVVADNIWEVRLGAGSVLLGALAGFVVGALLGLRAGRGAKSAGAARVPEDWSVNIAHRGGAKIAPENTLVAFERALDAGAGVLELDVHLTRDGHLVVIHDDTVDRTTDRSGRVREMTLSEIQSLDAGYEYPPYGGVPHPYRGKEIRVPTLEEVYREFPDVPINVEIKAEGRPDAVEEVWRVIRRAGAEGRTLVVSQDDGVIKHFRRLTGGKVATGSSIREIVTFDLLSRLGLSGLLKPRYRALQGPETYGPLHVVTPAFVRAAHELRIRVDVWTIDREADMRRLLGYGVDGIMTDRPDILARLLQGAGK